MLFFLDVRLESDDLQSQGGSVKKRWIRKDFDADGYFLLQLAERIERKDMFLTAADASSLTIQGTYLLFNMTTIIFKHFMGSIGNRFLCRVFPKSDQVV